MILIAYFTVNNILPYAPIKPNKFQSLQIIKNPSLYTPDKFNLEYQKLDFITTDNIQLKTHLIKAKNPKATIILLHGIANNKESFYNLAKKYVKLDINVVLIDLRAHGQSEGVYCTFGYYEKYDIIQLIDKLDSLKIQKPYGIFGTSLGGAIALQTLEIEKRLEFGIIESTFDRLENVILEYSEDIFQFKSKYLVNMILTKSGDIANFNPFEVNPSESCKSIDVPMFIAHGDIDSKIPIKFNQINYQNLHTKQKRFITVKDANHLDLPNVGGEKYWNLIVKFLVDYKII